MYSHTLLQDAVSTPTPPHPTTDSSGGSVNGVKPNSSGGSVNIGLIAVVIVGLLVVIVIVSLFILWYCWLIIRKVVRDKCLQSFLYKILFY